MSLASAIGMTVMCAGLIIATAHLSYYVDKKSEQVFPYIKTLLHDMNLKHPDRAAFFQTWFLLRRVFLAIAIVFCVGYPLLQVFSAVISSVFMLIILWKTNPFDSRNDQAQHLLNETIIFVASGSLLCFTDIYTDRAVRNQLTHLLLWLLISVILINLIFILISVCRRGLLYKKLWQNASDAQLRKMQQQRTEAARHRVIPVLQGRRQTLEPEDSLIDDEDGRLYQHVRQLTRLRETKDKETRKKKQNYDPLSELIINEEVEYEMQDVLNPMTNRETPVTNRQNEAAEEAKSEEAESLEGEEDADFDSNSSEKEEKQKQDFNETENIIERQTSPMLPDIHQNKEKSAFEDIEDIFKE